MFTNEAHWKPYRLIENNQTNSNWTERLVTKVFNSEMNTLLLFKVWISFHRCCIQSKLCLYSLEENHSAGYNLDVCKRIKCFLSFMELIEISSAM